MSVFRKIIFTDLCINGHLLDLTSEGKINECEVYQLGGRLAESFPKNFQFQHLNSQSAARFECQSRKKYGL